MSRLFFSAPVVINGTGCLKEAGDMISAGKKAMVVTGKTVVRQECTAQLLKMLDDKKTGYYVFSDITGEPDDVMIQKGADAYIANKCDHLIAIGGGSPMDAMKAIAVKLKYPFAPLREHMGEEIEGPFVPMTAIPTTAGTGSEVTMFTVITDTRTQVKMLLKGRELIPDIAVIDPEFSMSAPKSVTAHTGLDALTHAIEAYASKKAQPLTDVLAVSAVKRIMEYLPKAYDNGKDVEARTQMALAAYEAGVCITNSSVSLVHGMSRPVGALFHVPHGLSNAMLLPECLKFMKDGAYLRFAELGRATGAADSGCSDIEASEKFVRSVGELCRQCGVVTLEEYGVDKKSFFANIDKMASDAIASGSPANTRRNVTKEDCIELYKKLW